MVVAPPPCASLMPAAGESLLTSAMCSIERVSAAYCLSTRARRSFSRQGFSKSRAKVGSDCLAMSLHLKAARRTERWHQRVHAVDELPHAARVGHAGFRAVLRLAQR